MFRAPPADRADLEEGQVPVVTAGLVFVGLLCALDLILTLGVVKRLREHTELLSAVSGPPPALAVGDEVGAFSAATVDGEPVSREALADGTLVGFFSPSCRPCREKLPDFVRLARSGGRSRTLAVVVGDAEEAVPFVTELRSVARVVVEQSSAEPVGAAFKAAAYPTVLRVGADDDGRLVVRQDRVDLGRASVASA